MTWPVRLYGHAAAPETGRPVCGTQEDEPTVYAVTAWRRLLPEFRCPDCAAWVHA